MTLQEILDLSPEATLCPKLKAGLLYEVMARAHDPEALNFVQFGFSTNTAIIAKVLSIHNPKAILHVFDWHRSNTEEGKSHLKKHGLLERCQIYDQDWPGKLARFDRHVIFAHLECPSVNVERILNRIFKLMSPRGSILISTYSARPSDEVCEATYKALMPGWKIHLQEGCHNPAALITRSNL